MKFIFVQDLVCLNVTGMLQTRHQGQSVGKLGWVLDQLCATSYPDWHLRHCLISAGYFAQSLRDLLGRIGIPLWIEYTSGFSWQAYRALDLYVRPLVPGMPPPEFSCWFLLNAEGEASPRSLTNPEKWYEHEVWQCIGQRWTPDEWYIEPIQVVSRL